MGSYQPIPGPFRTNFNANLNECILHCHDCSLETFHRHLWFEVWISLSISLSFIYIFFWCYLVCKLFHINFKYVESVETDCKCCFDIRAGADLLKCYFDIRAGGGGDLLKWYFDIRADYQKQIMPGIYHILKAEGYKNDASIFLYAFQWNTEISQWNRNWYFHSGGRPLKKIRFFYHSLFIKWAF